MKLSKTLLALLGSYTTVGVCAEPALFSSVPAFQVQPTWKWVVGAAGVALVLGFVIGWRTLDRRIRKKYGGLRIY